MALSLTDLLAPLGLDRFLSDIWNRRPLHCRQSLERHQANELLDLTSLEAIIGALHRPEWGWLQLARGGRKPVPVEMLGEDGLMNLPDLYRCFAEGYTLYLTKGDRLSPALRDTCRALELEMRSLGMSFRRPVDAHIFLTPPGSQGFPAHRDDSAFLVVQLDGTKAWRIYDRDTEPAAPNPADLPCTVDTRTMNAEMLTFELGVGDVLYVPAGWAHEAVTQDSHSLHVTFRLFQMRWADVVLALGSRHPQLMDALPLHILADPTAVANALSAMFGAPQFSGELVSLIQHFAHSHAVPARPLPQDGLRQLLLADSVELDTRLSHRSGAACHVFVEDGKAVIKFPGGTVSADAVFEPVFHFVATTPRLRALDLPSVDPGHAYDRVEVARRLVRSGLLRLEDGGTSDGRGRDGATRPEAA